MSIVGPQDGAEFFRGVARRLERVEGRANRRPVPAAGPTGLRPDPGSVLVGFVFFDTTLGKPVWSRGDVWVDASGAPA